MFMKNYRSNYLGLLKLFVPLLFLPLVAQAHPLAASGGSFAAGFHHPFSGIDHIAVMLAAGITAARLGGKILWILPATFVSLTMVGAVFLSQVFATAAIMAAFSLTALVFAVLLCSPFQHRLGACLALTAGALGLLHGWGHGLSFSGGSYSTLAGLGIGSLILQLWGITFGLAARESFPRLLPYSCSAMVVAATIAAWLI